MRAPIVATILFSGLLAVAPASAQEMPRDEGREEMTEHHDAMARMKAAHAGLDSLVTAMRAAEGEAKVDAVAAVLEALIAQHGMCHEMMMEMHQHGESGGHEKPAGDQDHETHSRR